ncbi:MAG: hypothetical protein AB7N71_11015, partial [Phycisphaerae bacterium]
LYEVVNRSRRKSSKRRVPLGMDADSATVAEVEYVEPVESPPAVDPQPERIVIPAPRPRHLADEDAGATPKRAARFRWANEVLEARLDATDLMLVSLIAISLVIGAFFAGRTSNAPAEAARDDLAALVTGPEETIDPPYGGTDSGWPQADAAPSTRVPADEVFVPQVANPPPSVVAPPSAAQQPTTSSKLSIEDFLPGKLYIVLQHFPDSKKSAALEAQAYLKKGGVQTVLLEGSDTRLIAWEPFDNYQRAERSTLRKQIIALGADYTGGYKFDRAYPTVVNRGK